MSTVKKAGFVALGIPAALIIGLGTGSILGYKYAQHKATPPEDYSGSVSTTYTHQADPSSPGKIIMNRWLFWDAVGQVDVSSRGGDCDATITFPRPPQWTCAPPKNIFEIGLGGGYHCGYWLPGGTISYLRHVGGLGDVSFYVGPELAISAIDARQVSVELYVKGAVLW